MKKSSLVGLSALTLFFQFCCDSPTSTNPPATFEKSMDSQSIANVHSFLTDTTELSGEYILFLLPDSARFASLEGEPGIFDVDSDFGIAVSNTIDSISKIRRYAGIKASSTGNRFLLIKDCKGCPILIDRDSVNYGIVLTKPMGDVSSNYNNIHPGDYLDLVDQYFDMKNH